MFSRIFMIEFDCECNNQIKLFSRNLWIIIKANKINITLSDDVMFRLPAANGPYQD